MRHRFTEEQIIKILREAERGEQTISALCRTHGVSENTFYKWRQKYGGMEVADALKWPIKSRQKSSHV